MTSNWRNLINVAKNKTEQFHRSKKSYRATPGSPKIDQKEKSAAFAIDLKGSADKGQLHVFFCAQEQLRNGTSGPMKRIDLSHAQINSFTNESDREILWALLGQTIPGEAYYGYNRGFSNIILPFEKASSLLKQMSDANKLFVIHNQVAAVYFSKTESIGLNNCKYSEEECFLELSLVEKNNHYVLIPSLKSANENFKFEDVKTLVGPYLFTAQDENYTVRLSNLALFEDWHSLFSNQNFLEIPKAEVDQFLEYFFNQSSVPPILLPESLQFKSEMITPQIRLTLATSKRSSMTAAKIEFFYDNRWVSSRQGRLIPIYNLEKKIAFLRNDEFEQLTLARFKELNASSAKNEENLEIIADGLFLEKNVLAVIEKALSWDWEVVAHHQKIKKGKSFKISLASNIDWFDLSVQFEFEGHQLSLPQILNCLRQKQRLISLGDGQTGLLPEEWIQRFGPLADLGIDTANGLKLSPVQVLFLSSLENDKNFLKPDSIINLKQTLTDLLSFEKSEPKKKFKGTLREYQKEGLTWLKALSQNMVGGILADDMGLGKTVQILALLCEKSDVKKEKKPSLIVAPKSLIFNWINECKRFSPHLKILNYTGAERQNLKEKTDLNPSKYDIVITTYHTLRNDIEKFQKISFDYFILDEAHYVKNSSSQSFMACQLINAQKKLAMTGTPVENSLRDLFSILQIVSPGLISNTFIQKWSQEKDPESLKILAKALRPFLLRRTKLEVLKDLPEKTEQVLHCVLSPSERKTYQDLKSHYWKKLSGQIEDGGFEKSKIHILEALLRLRQASCHTGLLDTKNALVMSSKFELLLEQIESVIQDGHKALVFSQFTSLLSLLIPHLQQKKINYEYLDGKTTDREARVNNFQTNQDVKLFLLSLKAGGVGLNLTAADYVFILDPWWNPAAESQAIDRTHRIGQTRKVFAYKLIAKDTIEEKILDLQNSKKSLAKAIVSTDSLLKDMKFEDLRMLFE